MAFNNELFVLQQYKDLMDENIIITKTNIKGEITYVNEQFVNISGYSAEELMGNNHRMIRHEDMDREIFVDMWKTISVDRKTWTGQVKNKRKDGTAYYVDAIVRPLINEKNEITEFIALRYDVSEMVNAKRLLLDELVGTSNPILVVLQIENYEALENFYGKEITQIIEDKFADILIDYCPTGCMFPKVYQLDNGIFALVKEVEKTESIERQEIQLKKFQQNIKDGLLSFGAYTYDLNVLLSYSNEKKNIFHDVMNGLKELKVTKKDFIYANKLTIKAKEKAKENIHSINMIKNAIKNNKIVSFFQPLVNIQTGEIEKYESLVRLEKENGEILSPFFFLEASKDGKYYHQITEKVVENSFIALRKTTKEVSINLSTLDIEDVELRNKIIHLVATNTDLAPRIIFELLEDEEVHDFSVVSDFISLVKMFGVKIAIDDFGAGHSNFTRLLSFQPDILKLDGSLIKDIHTDKYSEDIVSTIVSFAKKQNIKTVAEFVSCKEVFDVVKELGIDYAQGFYLGTPTSKLVLEVLNQQDFK